MRPHWPQRAVSLFVDLSRATSLADWRSRSLAVSLARAAPFMTLGHQPRLTYSLD